MRETFSEWECMPDSAAGLIESMDAAGFDTDMRLPSIDVEEADAPESFASEAPRACTRSCLDLRHLPAPEPLERALAAAEALAPGEMLEAWTPMLPVPLLQLLQARGFATRAEAQDDGTARIFVTRVAMHGRD